MREGLKKALDNVEMTYSEIAEIADDLIKVYTADIDAILKTVGDVENLTNNDLRNLMMKLSLKAFSFGDIKEKAAIKAQCSEILRKEAYAKKFAVTEGAIATKDNAVILEISDEIIAEAVYDLLSGLFKVKLEEIRRMIDTLKTMLMSRLSEMKLSSGISSGLE